MFPILPAIRPASVRPKHILSLTAQYFPSCSVLIGYITALMNADATSETMPLP
jgi:hypothetical protein